MFTHRLVSHLPPQVGSAEVPLSVEGLFPAVGMHSMGEEVKVDLQARWHLEEDEGMMMVDSHEDDWGRLHDVRASGTVCVRKWSSLHLWRDVAICEQVQWQRLFELAILLTAVGGASPPGNISSIPHRWSGAHLGC